MKCKNTDQILCVVWAVGGAEAEKSAYHLVKVTNYEHKRGRADLKATDISHKVV
jgi:hypothetical protein